MQSKREQHMKKLANTMSHLDQMAAEVKSIRAMLIAKGYLEADGVTWTELGREAVIAAEMEPRRRYVGDLN
jgi:hypothetical protein